MNDRKLQYATVYSNTPHYSW